MKEKFTLSDSFEVIYKLDDQGRVVRKEKDTGELMEEIIYTDTTTRVIRHHDKTEIRKYYDDNGKLIRKEKYRNGILKKVAEYTLLNDRIISKRVIEFK